MVHFKRRSLPRSKSRCSQIVPSPAQAHLRAEPMPLGQHASKIRSWNQFPYCYLVRNSSFEKGGANSKKAGRLHL